MKRLFVFLKLVFIMPALYFTRLQSKKLAFEERCRLARSWSTFIIRSASVRLEVKNARLIPLENGYTFISNHDSPYDGLLLLAGNPLDFSFFVNAAERLPYMTPFLKTIESIRSTAQTRDDDLIRMSQDLKRQRNYHLFLSDPNADDQGTSLLNAAYLSKTAIVPVAIKNARSLMRFGYHKVTVAFCTPLHYEEYGSLSSAETLNEIKTRINTELKEGN